jgi:hypothetical protein
MSKGVENDQLTDVVSPLFTWHSQASWKQGIGRAVLSSMLLQLVTSGTDGAVLLSSRSPASFPASPPGGLPQKTQLYLCCKGGVGWTARVSQKTLLWKLI